MKRSHCSYQLLPAQSASNTLLNSLWDVAVFPPVMKSRDACLVSRDLETWFFMSRSWLGLVSLYTFCPPAKSGILLNVRSVKVDYFISSPAQSWTLVIFWNPTQFLAPNPIQPTGVITWPDQTQPIIDTRRFESYLIIGTRRPKTRYLGLLHFLSKTGLQIKCWLIVMSNMTTEISSVIVGVLLYKFWLVDNPLQTTPTSGLTGQSPLRWPRPLSGDWFQKPRP